MGKSRGFTLMEILIIIALISLLAAVVVTLLNPQQQVNKGKDARRKQDLDVMKKAFEDFYNDRSCYPKPVEVCYPGADNGNPVNKNPCFICGSQPDSPTLSPYLSQLPCDPDFPKKKYIYKVDNISCPQWFKIYTDFNLVDDPESIYVGCGNGGCGIAPPNGTYGYDYGVSSPNAKLDYSPYFYCYTNSNTCDNCITDAQCRQDSNCINVYGTFDICCSSQLPKPVGCP